MSKSTTILSQPINFHPSCLSNGETINFFDRFVSIDLGEVGVGYAVFNAATGDLLASNTKRLPSLARLPKMVRHDRKNRQPKQKFNQVFSTKLSDARGHAIGELKFFIDSLMNAYEAFPVFESTVSGLQSGSREIETVYKSILQYYTYSDVGTHKSERKSNWLSADRWVHPYLSVEEKIEKNGKFTVKTDKSGNKIYKDLNLFPGASVNPYQTSQTCSVSGINPIQSVRDHFAESHEKTLFINSEGRFTLRCGLELIVEKQFAFDDLPDAEAKDLRRRNRRAPWGKKYRAGYYNETEVLKMLKNHMRRPHENLRSPDTSQSQYVSPVFGAENRMHADENAAINIGRKWYATTRVKC